MVDKVEAVLVGKWTVGYAHDPRQQGASLLLLEWDDRAPINLAFPPDEAVKIANAILEQCANPPPKPDRMN